MTNEKQTVFEVRSCGVPTRAAGGFSHFFMSTRGAENLQSERPNWQPASTDLSARGLVREDMVYGAKAVAVDEEELALQARLPRGPHGHATTGFNISFIWDDGSTAIANGVGITSGNITMGLLGW